MENMTLADIAAVTKDNDFGGSAWLIILFVLLLFNGKLGGNGSATDAASQEILSGQKFDALSRQINAIGDGISSLGYNQLGKMDSMELNTQKSIDSLRYDMAQGFCAVKTASAENTQKILDALAQSKIDTLQARVNQLEMANAMSGVVKYPQATTYSSGTNPFCGCGCNGNM